MIDVFGEKNLILILNRSGKKDLRKYSSFSFFFGKIIKPLFTVQHLKGNNVLQSDPGRGDNKKKCVHWYFENLVGRLFRRI